MANKCETELEEVKAERDHWKKRAQELREETEELRRNIERLGIHAEVFGADMVRKYDIALKKLQIDRDRAQDEMRTMANTIVTYWDETHRMFDEAKERANEELELVNQSVARNGGMMPSNVQAVIGAFGVIQDVVEGQYQRVVGTEIEKRGGQIVPFRDWRLCLVQSRRLGGFIGMWDVAFVFALQAYILSNDPAVIASDALLQCRRQGAPEIETLNRLTRTWIDKHMGAGVKTSTILQGLKWAHNYWKSTATQEEFAEWARAPADRTLRKYLRWYEVFVQFEALKPEGIQTRYETQFL